MSRESRSAKVVRDAQTVLAALTRAAEENRACPSNLDIACLLGCGISHASKIVSDLEAAGLIYVQRGGVNRVVTIKETGKRTAGTLTNQHWSERGVKKFQPPPVARTLTFVPKRPVMPTVHRDPCPRCGTRADYGCAHSQALGLAIAGCEADKSRNPRPRGLRRDEGA